jgi:predicted PurR-regulated permease PerM
MTDSEHEESRTEAQIAADVLRTRVALRVSLYCVAILSVLYTLHYTRSLLMPFVVALFVSLLLSPLVLWFRRYRIPRPVSSVCLLGLLVVPLFFPLFSG